MNKELQGELRHLLQIMLSMPACSVRPANDNQPTEGESYAVMQVTEMNPTGWGTGGEDAHQNGVATITIDFIGKDSLHYASQLPLAMKTPYAISALFKLKLGYMSCTAARDLSAIEFERKSRHQVKMMISYSLAYVKPADFVTNGVINPVNIDLYVEP